MNQYTGSSIYTITNPLQKIPKSKRPKGCYVYLHRRATDNSIFYVGKGTGSRGWRLYNRGVWHHRCSIKNGVTVEVVKDKLSHEQACDLEVEMIKKIGLDNLVNISHGGDSGAKGIVPHNVTPVECSNGMTFGSASAGAKWVASSTDNKKATGSPITACCKGRLKSAYGFVWRYSGTDKDLTYIPKPERIAKQKGIAVVRSDGMEFRSSAEAGRFMFSEGVTKSNNAFVNIANACKVGCTAYGYKWQYKKGSK